MVVETRDQHPRDLLARAIAVLTAWERTAEEDQSFSRSVVADFVDDNGTALSEQRAMELIEGLVNLAEILLLQLEHAEQRSRSSILRELPLKYSVDC
jgi:hypothetical protein